MSTRLFNHSISEIEPTLYLGDLSSSNDLPLLREKNITAIVSLLEAPSPPWSPPSRRELVPEDRHLYISCPDNLTQDLLCRLPEICDFIDAKRNNGAHSLLVHCTAGISRSATVVLAYLMWKHRQPLEAALEMVEKSRHVSPNPNFMRQLAVWAEVDYRPWEDAGPGSGAPKPAYAEFLAERVERLKAESGVGG